MNLGLKDRVALVTGSSHGIGFEIAKALAQEGVKVHLCALNYTDVLRAAKSIDGETHARKVDVTNLRSIKKLFGNLSKQCSHLDILINNVGGNLKFGDFESLSDKDWVNAFEFNFMSTVRITYAALSLLRKSKNGCIVNIGSINGYQPGHFNPHYGAAKAALLHLNKYLANVLGKDGIRVNTICPSTIQGGAWKRNIADYAQRKNISTKQAEREFIEIEKGKSPLNSLGQLEDVGNLVTFLVSDKSKHMTGEVIDIDGGIRKSIK